MTPSRPPIYLDNNATTRPDPRVVGAMLPFLGENYGNPSSGGRMGRAAAAAVERARGQVAALMGCQPGEVLFTGGGTEANGTALHSALAGRRAASGEPWRVLATAVEHPSVLRAPGNPAGAADGPPTLPAVDLLGVDALGNLDMIEFNRILAAHPQRILLVSAMAANNETGVIFPVDEIAKRVRGQGAFMHVDAVQFLGKRMPAFDFSDIHFMSASAHKIHGPKGVGALYLHRHAAFHPLLRGGGQENQRRAGTENVPAIVGFGQAAELAGEALANGEMDRVEALRDQFEAGVLRRIPDVETNGAQPPRHRLPNTSNLHFAGIDAPAALLLLEREGVVASAGAACGAGRPSHVLRAMGFSPGRVRGSLRFSFSRLNTEEEVARALEILPRVVEKLRR